MLYGDFIDVVQEDTPRIPAPLDKAFEIRGHGTGLSTDSSRSLRSSPGLSMLWKNIGWSLTVAGNAVAGGLFLAALFYAPHVLVRLADFL